MSAFCTCCEEFGPYDASDPVCQTCGASVLPHSNSGDEAGESRFGPEGTFAGLLRAPAGVLSSFWPNGAQTTVAQNTDDIDSDAPSNPQPEIDFAALVASTYAQVGRFAGTGISAPPPASRAVRSALDTSVVDEHSPWLQQVSLCVDAVLGETVGTPAQFGPPWPVANTEKSTTNEGGSLSGDVVRCDPSTAAFELRNPKALAGNIAFCDRGDCPFVEKVRRCQNAGAIAVIIAQSQAVWPYVATDSRGEGGDIRIPCMMIRQESAESLKKVLRERAGDDAGATVAAGAGLSVVGIKTAQRGRSTDSKHELEETARCGQTSKGSREDVRTSASCSMHGVSAVILCRSTSSECSICQEVCLGKRCTRLPCDHFYHSSCIDQWLKRTNTCPLCRMELPTEDEAYEARKRRRTATEEQRQGWYQWYS